MAQLKHAIVLNLAGNIQRQLKMLTKELQKTGKDVSGVFSGANKEAQKLGKTTKDNAAAAEEQLEAQCEAASGGAGAGGGRRAAGGRRGAVETGFAAAGVAAGTAEGVLGGGTALGAAGSLATGAGGLLKGAGFLGKFAGPIGLGLMAAGGISSWMGKKAEEFRTSLDEYTRIGVGVGNFDTKGIIDTLSAEAKKSGSSMASVSRIASILIGQGATGGMLGPIAAGRGKAGDIAMLAQSIAVSEETLAQYAAQQARFGGTELKKAVSLGVGSGMKATQMGEFIESLTSLKESLLQSGIVNSDTSTDLMNKMGQLGAAFQGKYGGAIIQGAGAQIQAAAGGGGFLSNLLYGALQEQKLSFYQIQERAALGATGGNLEAVISYLKRFSKDVNEQAYLLTKAFDGISFVQAKAMLGLPDKWVKSGETTITDAESAYRGSALFTTREAIAAKEGLDKYVQEVTNRLETAIYTTSGGQQTAAAVAAGGVATPGYGPGQLATPQIEGMRPGDILLSDVERAAQNMGVSIQAEWLQALTKANVDMPTVITPAEVAKAQELMMEAMAKYDWETAAKRAGQSYTIVIDIAGKRVTPKFLPGSMPAGTPSPTGTGNTGQGNYIPSGVQYGGGNGP